MFRIHTRRERRGKMQDPFFNFFFVEKERKSWVLDYYHFVLKFVLNTKEEKKQGKKKKELANTLFNTTT